LLNAWRLELDDGCRNERINAATSRKSSWEISSRCHVFFTSLSAWFICPVCDLEENCNRTMGILTCVNDRRSAR